MTTSLSKDLRKLLEKVTASARTLAESACRAALENLAVHEKEYRAHMSIEQRLLRNRLRARSRALGDKRDERSGMHEIHHLTELAAYEHWHRLLFTRFLTENHLLFTDEAHGRIPVTLEECEELAKDLGARDGLDLACRFASRTLPGVFRSDDPVLDLSIALNDQVEMRKLLSSLPPELFRADDALGWTYQFWQAQRKKEVNKSGKKIGADELSPVTQLFTEDYMVEFLLHNTLGAWWAGKVGPIIAETEVAARAQVALDPRSGVGAISWSYLRFVQDAATKTWLPAAGIFDGWPKTAKLIRLLDPCMGSGHFLVFSLPLLVRLRMEEENLGAQAAVVAVLNDNIHGLELDERCTQIAVFNVALTAWKLAGYQLLPALHIACSGLAPNATKEEWIALAGKTDRLQRGMSRLYDLFADAPVLGSLINPGSFTGDMIEADFHELIPIFMGILSLNETIKTESENETVELAVIAQGLTKAVELLSGKFTLVITNVPYLSSGKQCDTLRNFCERHYPIARNELATVFLDRSLEFCSKGGSTSLVLPQNWLFLGSYKMFREKLLRNDTWHLIARLGPGAFETISGEVVKAILITLSKGNGVLRSGSGVSGLLRGIDVSSFKTVDEKETGLLTAEIKSIEQAKQLENPDARIAIEDGIGVALLQKHASGIAGIQTGDFPQFGHYFWEIKVSSDWEFEATTLVSTKYYDGKSFVLYWQNFRGELALRQRAGDSYVRGWSAFSKKGLLVSSMGGLSVTLYSGEFFDNNSAVIIPNEEKYLPAVWSFCSSPEYNEAVRLIDQKLNVTNATLVKVPFDLVHWTKIAEERYPNGLPKPYSDDPTQWIFHGHPGGSVVWDEESKWTANGPLRTDGNVLQIAVARLLGYRWPAELDANMELADEQRQWVNRCESLLPFADEDGIVCLPPVNREQPAASRLRQLLTAALGTFDERALIAAAGPKGSKSKTLEEWLCDEFFEQHTKLFHDRPFIWHLWDGRSDGFHALVNYHKLDHAALQKLTYKYLGDWIQDQAVDARKDKSGAAARLGAARAFQTKLAAILEGEAPLDIFVRWKPIKNQAQGWNPDINDGIRQNIRPFLFAGDVGKRGAGLFRSVPLKLKDKDRGTEPQRPKSEFPWFWCEETPGTDPAGGKLFVGNRWNEVHLTLAYKKMAGK